MDLAGVFKVFIFALRLGGRDLNSIGGLKPPTRYRLVVGVSPFMVCLQFGDTAKMAAIYIYM